MTAFAALAALALATTAAPVQAPPPNPFDRLVPLVREGDPMPGTVFVDQDGHAFAFSRLKGSTVAVAFVYTRCRDACPIITQKFGLAAAQLHEGRFAFVEVTIDPAHDTAPAIATYARRHGIAAPRSFVLTGAISTVEDFDRRMGVQAIASGPDDIIHNDAMVLVSPDGSVADIIDGSSWTAADVAAEMRNVSGQGGSLLARLDLALGKAAAYCGSAISGRSGIADLVASLAVIGGGIWLFWWLARRIFAVQG